MRLKAPSQQPPPNYDPLSPTSLRLYWDAPDYPNGIILRYFVYRDGEKVGEVDPSDGKGLCKRGIGYNWRPVCSSSVHFVLMQLISCFFAQMAIIPDIKVWIRL